MGVNYKITDNTELVKKAMSEQIEKALEKVGLTAEAYAKLNCPVDTGRLRNSITHAVAMDEKAVYIGTNVEYAPYVENGTSRQKAQPYLRPAAADHLNEYKNIVKDTLKEE